MKFLKLINSLAITEFNIIILVFFKQIRYINSSIIKCIIIIIKINVFHVISLEVLIIKI